MKSVIDYAENPDKTTDRKLLDDDLYRTLSYTQNDKKTDKQMYVSTINCPKHDPYGAMIATKKQFGKGCKGIVYHYYKCSGAKRRLGCKKKATKKHWIEETVVKLTISKVLTDEAIDRIADAILVMQEQGDTMTPVLKQQLQQCEAEIRNVMKAIRQGIITETTKECLEDLETQRDSLKASILQLQLERRKFTKEEIVEWISKYKYGNINDLDYRKEIIDTFVNSVFVYDDKLVLTYNYKDGSETLTLQEIEAFLSSNLTSMCPPKRETTHRVVFSQREGFLYPTSFEL